MTHIWRRFGPWFAVVAVAWLLASSVFLVIQQSQIHTLTSRLSTDERIVVVEGASLVAFDRWGATVITEICHDVQLSCPQPPKLP
jgi:hypothetical protein